MALRVGIIGCGLIGGKRAAAMGDDRVVAVCDPNTGRAQALGAKTGAEICPSIDDLLPRVDAVVISTTNDKLAEMSARAIQAKKHVLVEKPAARNARELEPLVSLAREAGVVVKVGFNHRCHPAARKAREILDAGGCGPVLFVRGRYGHGGRVGYDREWRADPRMSGGGELIDQGVHLIDLARWYLGHEFVDVQGATATYFWDMPVDDNAFMLLRTSAGQMAHLHVSCTEWKNLFSLEIYARDAKLHFEGLGGSYGVERLSHYQMRPEMGPPDTIVYEYPGPDDSWVLEWKSFVRAIAKGESGDLPDALEALRVVERMYGKERITLRAD